MSTTNLASTIILGHDTKNKRDIGKAILQAKAQEGYAVVSYGVYPNSDIKNSEILNLVKNGLPDDCYFLLCITTNRSGICPGIPKDKLSSLIKMFSTKLLVQNNLIEAP